MNGMSNQTMIVELIRELTVLKDMDEETSTQN